VHTQVNTNVAAMSDPDLGDYWQPLQELTGLLPAEDVVDGSVVR
jgi:hypothetical protein